MTSYYLGPFARCPHEYMAYHTQETACTNRQCSRFGDYLGNKLEACFCFLCGTKFGTVQVEKRKLSVNPWAMTQDEQLCFESSRDGNIYYYPNVDRGGRGDKWFSGTILPRTYEPDIVQNELEWFVATFESELDVLRNAYGADKIKIAWGLLST